MFDELGENDSDPLELLEKHNPLTGYSKYFKDGETTWQSCTVLEFSHETRHFKIKWDNGGVEKEVTRMNLRYSWESEEDYELRIESAKERRRVHEALVRYTDKLKQA